MIILPKLLTLITQKKLNVISQDMIYLKNVCKDAGSVIPFIVMNKWDKAMKSLKEEQRKKVKNKIFLIIFRILRNS